MSQLCSRVAMVRPHHFRSNEQTAADNRFQQLDDARVEAAVSRYAREEFDAMVAQLNQQGVRVEVLTIPRPTHRTRCFPTIGLPVMQMAHSYCTPCTALTAG